jgi:hypothetical protein
MIKTEAVFSTGQPFPPTDERSRLQTYESAVQLFEAEHERVFDAETKRIRPELEGLGRYIYNFPRRLTKLWQSLMLGETPVFKVGEENSNEQRWLKRWMAREKFISLLQMHRIDVSRFGDGLLKLYVENGKVKVDVQPPQYWFPVVNSSSITKITSHVLAWIVTVNDREFLRVEIHRPGEIEHKAFLLSKRLSGQYSLEREVSLATLGVDKPRLEPTELDVPLVFRTSNLLTSTSPYGFSDYIDISPILFEMEDRMVQLSRILDKHSDPSMYGPEGALWLNPKTQKWEFKKGGYLPLDSKEDAVPGYITWDGQITNALEQLNFLQRQLYVVSETSEAAFGQLSQGVAESGSALRRLLMAPLSKTSLVRAAYNDSLPEFFQALFALANRFENASLPDEIEFSAEWRDGLPNDPTEDASIVSSLRPGEVSMSDYEGVRKIHPDWSEEQIELEVGRLEEDRMKRVATMPGAGAETFPRGEE